MHEGHRKRMMERLMHDAEGLQDHELLEILLFYALPRVNTNPLAHELLRTFGSVDGVFGASVEELRSVDGIGASAAGLIRTAGQLYRRACVRGEAPVRLNNPAVLLDLARERLGGLDSEAVECYLIGKGDRVKFIKRFSTGRSGEASFGTEELMRILAAQQPGGLAVAHNHPHGKAQPSQEDDVFTARVQMICAMQEIVFYDHIIVGESDCYSYFTAGTLGEIKEKYNLKKILQNVH